MRFFRLLSYITILAFLLFCQSIFAQATYVELIHAVDHLETKEERRRFWMQVIERDQKYRGKDATIQNDFENIKLAAAYYNKYGYPTKDVESTGHGLLYVWIHSWNPDIAAHTFPMLWQGYEIGAISNDKMRNYILKGHYHSSINDGLFDSLSNTELIAKLGFNMNEKISIPRIDSMYHAYMSARQKMGAPFEIWEAQPTVKEYRIRNEIIEDTIHGIFVEIYDLNGVSYLRSRRKEWKEDIPRPLIFVNGDRNRFKTSETNINHYERDSERLILKNIDGDTLQVCFPYRK